MDNLMITKIWEDYDGEFMELRIEANCEFASAFQNCYFQNTELERVANDMIIYSCHSSKIARYHEFGCKGGNHPPAFSMYVLPADKHGHVKIEVDLEIDDNDARKHRCCFYVNSDLGCIERFGRSLKRVAHGVVGVTATLHP